MSTKHEAAQFLETAYDITRGIEAKLSVLAKRKHHDRCIISDVSFGKGYVSFDVLDDGLQNGSPLFVERIRLSNDEVLGLY